MTTISTTPSRSTSGSPTSVARQRGSPSPWACSTPAIWSGSGGKLESRRDYAELMQQLSAIGRAGMWRQINLLRNRLAHAYPTAPDLQARIVNEALDLAPEVIAGLRGGGPAPAPVTGDTVSLCVVDSDRMAVSLLQSNFVGWGSMRFVPDLGIALHNRGSSFSLRPRHPAEYGPGRRPPHTLAPVVATGSGGRLEATLATRGGQIQPQVLLQLLARVYPGAQTPGEALAAGRWAIAGDWVRLEGHAPKGWFDGLAAWDRRVIRREAFSDEFGHAQLIVRRGDHLAAASDPRSPTWAAAIL